MGEGRWSFTIIPILCIEQSCGNGHKAMGESMKHKLVRSWAIAQIAIRALRTSQSRKQDFLGGRWKLLSQNTSPTSTVTSRNGRWPPAPTSAMSVATCLMHPTQSASSARLLRSSKTMDIQKRFKRWRHPHKTLAMSGKCFRAAIPSTP